MPEHLGVTNFLAGRVALRLCFAFGPPEPVREEKKGLRFRLRGLSSLVYKRYYQGSLWLRETATKTGHNSTLNYF